MTTLRSMAWTVLLLAAVSGPHGCPHKRHRGPMPPPVEEPPPEPPPPVSGPVLDAASFTIAPIGAPLVLDGTGFLNATIVTIGGQEQMFIEILDDTRIRIRPLMAGTPMGAQDVVVESADGASAPLRIEVVQITVLPGWLAHGATAQMTLEGLAQAPLQVDARLGGVPLDVVSLGSGQYALGPIPDDVPSGRQDLRLTSDGVPHAPLSVPVIRLLLNELDVCQPSRDDGEFIEISTGAADVFLDGYVIVLFNGSSDQAYRAIDLAGASVGATNADGLLVIGNESVVGAASVGNLLPTSTIQNGADAVVIYQGSIDLFPNGTTVTNLGLIDALVYDTADADDAELLDVLLGVGAQALQVDEDAAGDGPADSIARITPERLDGRAFGAGVPTPGAPNVLR